MARNVWTREETIIAFNVYCKIPFKDSRKTHPLIIKYAQIIGRSPSALNMKIGNFGRLDPELRKQGITGLGNGGKMEEMVWEEFNGDWERLAFESEELIAKFQNKEIAEVDAGNFQEGKERETTVKARVNQSFFRSTVLSSYGLKCCVTGLSVPKLLEAGHIKPWSEDKANRANPHNGLCLNTLHHRAFDEGFFTITPDFKVRVSKYFDDYPQDKSIGDFFSRFDNQSIIKPDRFLPGREFLDYHYEHIFIK